MGSSAHLEMSLDARETEGVSSGPHRVVNIDLMHLLWESFTAMRKGLLTVRSKLSSRPPNTHPSLGLSQTPPCQDMVLLGHNPQLLSKLPSTLSQLLLSVPTSSQSAFSYLF